MDMMEQEPMLGDKFLHSEYQPGFRFAVAFEGAA